jgi:drug/metabolite transporter (DMT)-like permease
LVPPENLWIPVTIFAAFAQTIRNATQKHLTASLGTLGATLVRFLYGLPFAAAWLVAVHLIGDFEFPAPNAKFLLWIVVGAIGQIGGTALLLRVVAERNFTLGVAYSKTEALQVAFFGAVMVGTLGVLLMSPADPKHPLRALVAGWTSKVALLGLACGTAFSFAAVGYRGGALALENTPYPMAAAFGLVLAQLLQTLLLGAWLAKRRFETVVAVCREWRTSLMVGFFGAAASIAWFVAMAIEPIAHVRTLALVELLFAYAISRRVFRERLTKSEMFGIALLTTGIAVVTFGR